MSMDMSQYLDVFLEESREHLGNLNQKLLQLEKNTDDLPALNEIFRAAHTLKGMSSTMGFEDMADLTHHMENILADLKDGILQADSNVVDTLFKCFDRLQMLIDNIESAGNGEMDNSDLITLLENLKLVNFEKAAVSQAEVVADNPALDHSASSSADYDFNEYELAVLREAKSKGLRIFYIKVAVNESCVMKSVRAFMVFKVLEEQGDIIKSIPVAQELDEGKFDTCFEVFVVTQAEQEQIERDINNISEVKIEEISRINPVALQDTASEETEVLEKVSQSGYEAKKTHKIKQTVRVDIERLDNLMNLVGELVMHKGRLEQIGSASKLGDLNEAIEQIDRISADLQSVVMKVRMVPIEQVFNRFPRMVRDVAKELNKEVDFIMEGKETELDRTVIDEIGDPLVHLLRNAVDHGLESTEERVKKGKNATGRVSLRARHEGNNVFIEVEDDGQGIDTRKVKSKAIQKGIVSVQEADKLTAEEITDLLFLPGFSTAATISDISGRGVGLDVVKTKIESLSGEISIESHLGQGTKFRIKLPLTLAIIQALMVAIKDEIYAIPLSSVDETTMIKRDDIKMVQNQEVIMLRGNVLPIYRLATLLDTPGGEEQKEDMYVVVVRKAEHQMGLVVDTLIGQQEIVIKSLGKKLSGIPGIAGGIVAGDGNVRLILDIATLL